jgi:hypothetical protein
LVLNGNVGVDTDIHKFGVGIIPRGLWNIIHMQALALRGKAFYPDPFIPELIHTLLVVKTHVIHECKFRIKE